jgi:hypothetical protein
MDRQAHVDAAVCNLVNVTHQMRTAAANLRADDPASNKMLQDAKAALVDALAKFYQAVGLPPTEGSAH